MSKKEEESFSKRHNLRWVFMISFWTFVLAIGFLIVAENLVANLDIYIAFIVLIVIILIGILFDIIGIAVKYAIRLVRNAGIVSNFCNDVIGDICGIVSGAAGTTIIFKLIASYPIMNATLLSILISALVASLTVGGKAFGKSIAITYHEKILYSLAKFIFFLEKNFNIKMFNDKNKK